MKRIFFLFSCLFFVQSVDAVIVLDLRNQHPKSIFHFGITHKNAHFQHPNYADFYASKKCNFQYYKKLAGNRNYLDLINNFEQIDHDLEPFLHAKQDEMKSCAYALLYCVDVGIAAANAEKFVFSKTVADFCSSGVAVLRAVANGVKLGIKNGVNTLAHPILTMREFARSARDISQLIGGLLIEDPYECCGYFSQYEFFEVERVRTECWSQFDALCEHTWHEVTKLSACELIEKVTAVAVENLFFGSVLKIISSLPQLLENAFLIAKKRPSKVSVQLMDGSILMVDPAEPIGFRESPPLPAPSLPKPTFNLKNLCFSREAFSLETLEHIFFGVIKKGKVAGFHYNGIHNGFCEIVEGTIEYLENGIYKANVKIGGILKKAKSTFFPDAMSPQQIIDAIIEAYHSRALTPQGYYKGATKYGFEIEMYLDSKGKIKTAYPHIPKT